jgi:hypothetical protein
MKKFLSIASVLLVFFGSVGIPLYQHTCLHEDITINTLFTASDHCEDGHEAVEETPDDCCAVPEPAIKQDQLSENHCCSEDISRLAMSFDYFEQWQLAMAVIPTTSLSVEKYLPYAPSFPTESQIQFAANTDPPALSGRQRLCANCILRL